MEVGSVAGDLGKRYGKTAFTDDSGDSSSMDTRMSKKAKSASLNLEEPGFSTMDPISPIYSPKVPGSPIYSPKDPGSPMDSPTDPVSLDRQTVEDYPPEERRPIVIDYDPIKYIKTFMYPPHLMDTRRRSSLKAKEACLDPKIKRFLNWLRKTEEEEEKDKPTEAQALDQAKKYADIALKDHFSNKEKKYVLVKPGLFRFFRDIGSYYVHVNFTAKQMDQDDSEAVLFFAELTLKPVRNPGDLWYSTCCSILKGEILGGCLGKSIVNQNDGSVYPRDLKRCYACHKKLKHPSGNQYNAGHCSKECVYEPGC